METRNCVCKDVPIQTVLLWVTVEGSLVPKFREEILPASSRTSTLNSKAVFYNLEVCHPRCVVE